jgi:DNA recombination protein RmuC
VQWFDVLILLFSAAALATAVLVTRKIDAGLVDPAQLLQLNAQLLAMREAQSVALTRQTEQIEHLRTVLANEMERSRRENAQLQERMVLSNERKLAQMMQSNGEQLELMRRTVDERLQKTLETRLQESFKAVSAHLESVQRGLGEMQSLASDVGGLKKALTNVKVRGTFGEIQLERILEQMLTVSQYEKNAATKHGSADRVEFALRLPGKGGDQSVFLPIDSKFPIEDYERLLAGYDAGDKALMDAARRNLSINLRNCAKAIHDKYIDPPNTTDFAILFLPTEGLYAEVVQNAELFEQIQHDYKVTVTGPTTLSAFLNALQMGFQTLAIEKRSVEVWQVLGAVRTEFDKFADALQATQKKLRAAEDDLEKLVGTRTTVLQRKLRQVEALPAEDAQLLLLDGE